MLGKASDMHFINRQILHWDQRLGIISPVKIIFNHSGLIDHLVLGASPDTLSGHRLGIDIQKHVIFIKKQPLLGIIGTVHAVSILKIIDIKPEDNHGIHLPDLVIFRERDHRIGLILLALV